MVERFADVGRRLTPAVAVVPQGYGLRDNNHVSTRGADAYVDASTFSLTRPVDGRASDPEQVGEVSGAVLTTFEESDQVRFLAMIQLGLLTTQAPLGLGDLHPFPGTQPNQIRTQLSHHRQHVEDQPAYRIGRVIHRPAQVETNLSGGELVSDGL